MPCALEHDTYRPFQDTVIPGISSLHRITRAIFETKLSVGAKILIVGAGGGREIQNLGMSPADYKLYGVDPSPQRLALAREYAIAGGIQHRTSLLEGTVEDLPLSPDFAAATSFFVMHFLPNDMLKHAFLTSIRSRLTFGASYIHADVCFEGKETYQTLRSVYAAHAVLGGLEPALAQKGIEQVGNMSIDYEPLFRERLEQNGFRIIAPIFRVLWYTAWWTEAV